MEPLRPFYAEERKVLLMLRIKPQRTRLAWHALAAAVCFVLAVIAGLSGSLLTTNAILNAHEHPALYAVGLISLILALPIAILGAHCLDLIDQQKRSS
jgi:uncharacterized membrane protein